MTEQASPQTGNLYDLGYRNYTGARLGRRFAVLSLFLYSLRSIFGLGRGWISKLFSIGLAVIAFIPALFQMAIAAVAPLDITFIKPEDYFGYVSIVLALFCAVAAPEIIGRDQRTRTLSLYFSRALSRMDYAAAKLFALVLSLFGVLVLPQLVLRLGEAVAAPSLIDSLKDDADLIPPILASSAIIALMMGAISVVIAAQSSRRAIATGAVLAYFVVFTLIGTILLETLSGDGRGYALLISPVGVLEGTVYWLFGTPAPVDSDLARADLSGGVYFAAGCVYAAAAIGFFVRKIQRMSV